MQIEVIWIYPNGMEKNHIHMHGLCETCTDTNARPDWVRKCLSKSINGFVHRKILAKFDFDCDVAFKMTTNAEPLLWMEQYIWKFELLNMSELMTLAIITFNDLPMDRPNNIHASTLNWIDSPYNLCYIWIAFYLSDNNYYRFQINDFKSKNENENAFITNRSGISQALYIMMAMLPCTAHPNWFKSKCTLFQLIHWLSVFHAVRCIDVEILSSKVMKPPIKFSLLRYVCHFLSCSPFCCSLYSFIGRLYCLHSSF